MRAPLSWIKEFAPIDRPVDEIVSALNQLGLEVEQVDVSGAEVSGVKVARVVKVMPHPDADRLVLVDLDTDQGGTRVVCGATNLVSGMMVPHAGVGAQLPGGLTLASRKIRGEVSDGMLCSSLELGVGDDARGILKRLQIANTFFATPLVKAVTQGMCDAIYGNYVVRVAAIAAATLLVVSAIAGAAAGGGAAAVAAKPAITSDPVLNGNIVDIRVSLGTKITQLLNGAAEDADAIKVKFIEINTTANYDAIAKTISETPIPGVNTLSGSINPYLLCDLYNGYFLYFSLFSLILPR
jgi:tRNA-binding EMAP/Myf-like protein